MVETLITVTGTDITHDETAGLQNLTSTPTPAGDADDDDVLYSSLPTAFSSRLATLTAATPAQEVPIGAAASPGNVVTFSSAGTLGNVALTDAAGDPLDGDDSGLTTTSGEKIYLYSDTANDNIVLGKTDDGTIVFAIYLEETGGSPPTGAKLWTVQYEAIDHDDDGNNFDSAKSLTDKVYVTASEAQTFSFANAPSGQNLFMAFGNATQALLITGEDPANQSAGENVSSGSTVNSSQGGGTTTLGTDGQQIKAQKALVITFISGANPDYLAGPNAGNGTGEPLSPTEATVEANIQFSGYVLADAAEFTISQMQPNNAAVAVEIAAYLTADASGNGYIDGNPLVQGDSQIAITGVQVFRGGVNVVGTQGVAVNLDGDGAVITGVRTGDIVKYVTDGDHNRVLIRNDQPTTGSGSNIAFDLGGFTLTEVDGDTDEIGSNIFFEDDGPSIALGTDPNALIVDETDLNTNDSESFAGLFVPSFGADGEAATGARLYELGIGVADANSGLVDTATGRAVWLFLSADKTTITGKEGIDLDGAATGNTVFVISVNGSTGVVSLDQQRAIVHPTATLPDESKTLADGVITLTATAKDGDLDTASHTENVGDRFTFKDDGPAVTVDDATGTYAAGADGVWTPDPGEDGFKSLGVSFDSFEIAALGSQTTTAANSTFEKTGDYSFAGSITGDFTDDGVANSQTVKFTLTFDPDNETYDLSVTEVPTSVVVRDSSQGALKASGPNPVRTLLFGGSEAGADDVLFFGVVANAPAEGVAAGDPPLPNDLEDLIVVGATDLDEGQIRAYLSPTNRIPTLINSSTQMNVSTSGIGINNNNLDGSGTGIQAGDESFVFNPEEVVDGVRVYIDSSVGGYDTATEDLYYRIYYTDGTVSGQTEVTSGMLEDALRTDPMVPQAARGGKYFEIDGGDKKIDAVQLTMGTGTIKVPVIQWSIETTFDPQDLQLDFTATLTDGDSDPDTDPFSVFLSETTT